MSRYDTASHLRKALERLVGADTKEELVPMANMLSAFRGNADADASIGAIEALLDTTPDPEGRMTRYEALQTKVGDTLDACDYNATTGQTGRITIPAKVLKIEVDEVRRTSQSGVRFLVNTQRGDGVWLDSHWFRSPSQASQKAQSPRGHILLALSLITQAEEHINQSRSKYPKDTMDAIVSCIDSIRWAAENLVNHTHQEENTGAEQRNDWGMAH